MTMSVMRRLLPVVLLAGCSGDRHTDGAVVPPTFAQCRGRAFSMPPAEGWRHLSTSVVVAAGAPNHSAQDVIATPGGPPALAGKFSYGTTSIDLDDEDVAVVLDDCTRWRNLGVAATDSDGRMSASAPSDLDPGVYEVRFQVLGDGSSTMSYLWILPAGTHVVVTDIDGTLTQSDSELFREILDGSHVPVPYPGAVALTKAHHDAYAVVVYLTGRPYWLTGTTRDWLTSLGFAPGPLRLTDSEEDAVPTESGVGAYKLAWLQSLTAKGYLIDFAYGNASTDISAYGGAGISADVTWIIGPNGGASGTHAVADSWVARANQVRVQPKVQQPY